MLDENGQAIMTELALALGMERTTVLRALKPLQRRRLVETTPSAGDSRRLALSLTATGLHKLEQATPLWQHAQREFEGRVGAERGARLRGDLLALAEPD